MSSSIRDFADSRSSSIKHTNLLQGRQTTTLRNYVLIQENQDRQTLIPTSQEPGPSYHIKFHDQIGSIFRKPRMVITKEQRGRSNSVVSTKSSHSRRRSSIFSTEKGSGKVEVATVEINMHETDIKVVYKGKSYAQTLSLSDPATQAYNCSIDGQEHQWRPLGPSRMVLELVIDNEQRVALFVYAEYNPPVSETGIPRRVSLGVRHEVGELHTIFDVEEQTRVHEEVLCSALAVVQLRRIT